MFAVFDNSPKCLLYKHVVSNNLCLQPYLQKPIASKYKHILSKYRLSAHSLSIETGRYHQIDRNYRICSLCNMNILEDEYHFVLVCPFYSTIRDKYINTPSTFKLTQLMYIDISKHLIKLCKYLTIDQITSHIIITNIIHLLLTFVKTVIFTISRNVHIILFIYV